ncbi:GNAT family N-acetyltransferase [Caloramator mitchellensis]|nr:GNAT family protein [Caloramator mitchellensis]
MLKGNKTYIRAIEMEDARILSAWLNDRETNEHLDIIYPISKRYCDNFTLEGEEHNKKVFIIENEDRKPIGLIIIDNIKWEYRNCEIGIAIYDKNFRGKGYAKDALSVVIDFIFNDMNMHLIHLRVSEENKTAIELYNKFGFVVEGMLRDRYYRNGKYHNIIIMSKIKGE